MIDFKWVISIIPQPLPDSRVLEYIFKGLEKKEVFEKSQVHA